MSLCSVCAAQLWGDAPLCAHHDLSEEGWAAQNRIMCDLLHRGVAPSRVPAGPAEGIERACSTVTAGDSPFGP